MPIPPILVSLALQVAVSLAANLLAKAISRK